MSKARPYTAALILSAGSGARFSREKTKQKFEIGGISILRRTLLVFDSTDIIDEIVLAYKADEEDFAAECARGLKTKITLVEGGSCRAESARRAFNSLRIREGIVMIQDAARCLVTPENITAVANACYKSGAASAALRVTDTVKRISSGLITQTLDREELVTVATPQAFSYELYERALGGSDSESITDDNMRVERLGIGITPVFTSKENIKITSPEDSELAEYILMKREQKRLK